MDQEERTQRRQSRTVVLAALIGAAGAILAAIAGHQQGREQGVERQAALERELEASSAEVSQLRKNITEQAKNISMLQERLKQVNVDPSVIKPEPVGPDSNPKLVNNYRFELQGCRSEGSNIVCSFLATNLEGDRDFELNYQSGMIDSSGEPHEAERLFAGGKMLADNGDIHLVTGVPTAFSFRLVGLAASVRRIALLEIKSRGFSIQWRNVDVANS